MIQFYPFRIIKIALVLIINKKQKLISLNSVINHDNHKPDIKCGNMGIIHRYTKAPSVPVHYIGLLK